MAIIHCVFGIYQSQETLNLRPKSYTSAAGGDTASVMAVLACTGVTIFIAMNACEDALPWCWHVFFSLSTLLPAGKSSFLLVWALCVNHISSVNDRLWCLPTSQWPCLSPSCINYELLAILLSIKRKSFSEKISYPTIFPS